MDPDKWEFANEEFLRGQRHLLKNIKRRKTPTTTTYNAQASNQGLESCVEIGSFGLEGEIERLKRDKQVLMMEMVKLRQQQHHTNTNIKEMEQRLKGTELKQQQTMSFLARAIKNPTFLQQMQQKQGKMKEIEEEIAKKRAKRINHGSRNVVGVPFGVDELGLEAGDEAFDINGGFGEYENVHLKLEPQEFDEIGSGFDVEFETLAMSSMNMGNGILDRGDNEDDLHNNLDVEKPFDEALWGDLINEALEDEIKFLRDDP